MLEFHCVREKARRKMNTINIELSFDQLLKAVRKLPHAAKMRLWQILDAELNHVEINREFASALEEIWTANESVSEDEVAADVATAIREVRAEDPARRS